MAKTKKEPDYAAELQKSFEWWDSLKTRGGSDPFYSDGSNMNGVRGHIISYKMRIEQSMTPEQYPEVYYRETPPEVDREYMARADEIRANAKKTLEAYKADPDYQFLCKRVPHLTERQKKDAHTGYVLGYVPGLADAISKDDLITMRRHEDASRNLDSFSSCAGRVRNLKPPENEQMSIFADYGHDSDYGEDEDEWDCEM